MLAHKLCVCLDPNLVKTRATEPALPGSDLKTPEPQGKNDGEGEKTVQLLYGEREEDFSRSSACAFSVIVTLTLVLILSHQTGAPVPSSGSCRWLSASRFSWSDSVSDIVSYDGMKNSHESEINEIYYYFL